MKKSNVSYASTEKAKDFRTTMYEWAENPNSFMELLGTNDLFLATKVMHMLEEAYEKGIGYAYTKVAKGEVTAEELKNRTNL